MCVYHRYVFGYIKGLGIRNEYSICVHCGATRHREVRISSSATTNSAHRKGDVEGSDVTRKDHPKTKVNEYLI